MNEESSRSIDPQPFAEGPTEPGAGGCGKPALIGCGVLLLLVGIAALVFLVKARSIFDWVLDRVEEEVVRALPEDLAEGERRRLEEAFEAAGRAVLDDRADPADVQELQGVLFQVTQKASGEGLSREEVTALTRALEKVAGTEEPDRNGAPESEGVADGGPEEALFIGRSPPLSEAA